VSLSNKEERIPFVRRLFRTEKNFWGAILVRKSSKKSFRERNVYEKDTFMGENLKGGIKEKSLYKILCHMTNERKGTFYLEKAGS